MGVKGDRSVQNAASGRAATGSRSPRARLPTWSWSAEKTTKRSGGTSSAGAPKRRLRNAEYVPSWTCGRLNALPSSASESNSPYQPSVSPVSSVRSAWWKSSAQAASQPWPPSSGTRITRGSLRPDSAITSAPGPRAVDAAGDLRHQVLGARVDDRVDRVQPQAVEVEVAHPPLGALADPLAHGVALLVVDVEARAPRRVVLLVKYGPKASNACGPGRADVVVDDVEDHRQAERVRGVDELLQAVRPAVGGLGRAQVDAVVAPAVRAGELRDRHHLDRRHAELGERLQMRDRAFEGPLGRERADVQLVDDAVGQVRRPEVAVGPLEAESGRPPARARAGRPAASASTDRAAPRRPGRTRSRPPRPASTVASKMPKPTGSSACSAPLTRRRMSSGFGAQTRNSVRPVRSGNAPSRR